MSLVLRGGTLIDGTGAAPVARCVVVVEGERIARVGTETDFGSALAELGEVKDVTGRFVLPGLINTHEHLDNRGGIGTFHDRAAEDTHWLTLRSFRACLWNLRDGVTTVREMGGKGATGLVVKQAVETGMILGPRVFTCGQAIAMTGGHGDDVCYIANGTDETMKAARVLIRKGADLVKVMASGGNLTVTRDYPWSPQLNVVEMRAAFAEGEKGGTAHGVACTPAPKRSSGLLRPERTALSTAGSLTSPPPS